MDDEEWRSCPLYPGILASSHGRIKATDRVGTMPKGGTRVYAGKPWTGAWDGERFIFRLRGRTGKVARAVCSAFHGPAPFAEAKVLHADEDSRNNRPDNLSWGTQKENLNAPGFKRYRRQQTGENSATWIGREYPRTRR